MHTYLRSGLFALIVSGATLGAGFLPTALTVHADEETTIVDRPAVVIDQEQPVVDQETTIIDQASPPPVECAAVCTTVTPGLDQ